MRSRNSTLIKELLSLYVKYGADAFEAAARELREGNVTETIAETAEHLREVARRAKVGKPESSRTTYPPRKSKQELLAEQIANVRNTGNKSDFEIPGLVQNIIDRQILKTPGSLREYMAFIGVPMAERHGDRYDSAKRILEFLKTLPEHELGGRIRAIEHVRGEESSLQKWTNIIVKPER
jgi:hypothetical protein